MDNKWK